MAKQIGVTRGGNIKSFQALTTDDPGTYPTITDCAPGSKMILINPTTHAVAGFKYFDGTDWNTI